jgi:hypothetical protein
MPFCSARPLGPSQSRFAPRVYAEFAAQDFSVHPVRILEARSANGVIWSRTAIPASLHGSEVK